jgi:hypothetical protein
MNDFKLYEGEAREAGRGLWGEEIVVEKKAEKPKAGKGKYVASRMQSSFKCSPESRGIKSI